MKNYLWIFLLVMMISCHRPKLSTESFPNLYQFATDEWATYEGTIELPSGEVINVELSLKAGSPGFDSYYKFNELENGTYTYMWRRFFAGTYTTLMGASPDEFIVQLHGARMGTVMVTGEVSEQNMKKLMARRNETTELYFKSVGSDQLVLTDEYFRPISDDQKHVLVKRSRLFTVEGYVTFVNDTSEYFEQNTRENWALANYGLYDSVRSQYQKLATEKYEGIYLKGLAYTVAHIDASGKDIDALTIKDIYEMHPGKFPQ